MDVSDEPEPAGDGDEQKSATGRKKRSDAGRPRSSKPSSRFQRRAEKATETVRELVRIRLPELDVSDLSFAETVDRDAQAWGDFLAQLGEWLVPFGTFLDLVFGVGLIRILRVAPSFRAARRELVERRERRAAEREARENAELREAIAADHEQAARESGVFAEVPTAPPEQTREEWLANGGAGE